MVLASMVTVCYRSLTLSFYQDVLWSWLMKDQPDMTRLPIAISAFGLVFYYRLLSEDGDEDISFIDPQQLGNWGNSLVINRFF